MDNLKWNEQGLIPAIVKDTCTGQVLMMAWMNRESLEKTMETGLATFYSRSRRELWVKGATSGNLQHVVHIKTDCDRDSLLLEVRKDGPACHLGRESCFEEVLFEGEEKQGFTLDALYALIKGRKDRPQEGSYTTYLFNKGLDKILKKVGEECTEVIIAGKAQDKKETIYEISDLAYHVLVLMAESGITVDEIKAELASRHVVDHKTKQEKMA